MRRKSKCLSSKSSTRLNSRYDRFSLMSNVTNKHSISPDLCSMRSSARSEYQADRFRPSKSDISMSFTTSKSRRRSTLQTMHYSDHRNQNKPRYNSPPPPPPFDESSIKSSKKSSNKEKNSPKNTNKSKFPKHIFEFFLNINLLNLWKVEEKKDTSFKPSKIYLFKIKWNCNCDLINCRFFTEYFETKTK